MWGAVRALIWGENLTSDPVGAALGFALRYLSKGQLSVDVAALSQVSVGWLALSKAHDTQHLHSRVILP
jgi:hypothetical protein